MHPDCAAAEPKRVLVVTITTGFRHSSIASAERALQKLADDSGDFQIVEFLRQPTVVVPKKPNPPRPLSADADEAAKKRFEADNASYQEALAKFPPERIAQAEQDYQRELNLALSKLAPAALDASRIDGVIFANTTGDLPLPDKDGFIQWVENGHAFMAMHSASDTLHGFRPYIALLGGEFESHGSQASVDLTALDPAHPAAVGIQSPWRIPQEEMYHFKAYERSRVRDIWASDRVPMDKKADQGELKHFPVSWVRSQGTGRIFYTSLGHREDLWDERAELSGRVNPPEVALAFHKHLLGGIRWALGLASGSAEPQSK